MEKEIDELKKEVEGLKKTIESLNVKINALILISAGILTETEENIDVSMKLHSETIETMKKQKITYKEILESIEKE